MMSAPRRGVGRRPRPRSTRPRRRTQSARCDSLPGHHLPPSPNALQDVPCRSVCVFNLHARERRSTRTTASSGVPCLFFLLSCELCALLGCGPRDRTRRAGTAEWRVGATGAGHNTVHVIKPYVSNESLLRSLQAALAMKRLGPSTCFPLIVPSPPEPAPCPVFAAFSYL